MTRLLLAALFAVAAPVQVLADAPQAPAPAVAPAAAPEPENALKYLREAARAHIPPPNPNPTVEEARPILEENAEVFALVERALALPLRFEGIDWSAPDGFNFISKMRSIARLLSLRSRAQAQDKDWDGAARSCLQAVALGLKMQEDGPLITALSAFAVEAIGSAALQKLAPELGVAQLKLAAARLHALEEQRPSLRRVLAAERAVSENFLAQMFDGGAHAFEPAKRDALIKKWRDVVEAEDELLSRPFALARALDLRGYEEAEAEDDAAPAGWPGDAAWIEAMQKTARPAKHGTMLQRARIQARIAMLEAALAARAYAIEHKELPGSAQVLAPDVVPALLNDPFELEAPLRFKIEGKILRIYSVGPDGPGRRRAQNRRQAQSNFTPQATLSKKSRSQR
jgi:hypothetical protein